MAIQFNSNEPPAELLPTAKEIFLRSRRIWPKRPVSILGASPAMANVLTRIRKYAKFGEPVLVRGESGTGKELIARAIYLMSDAIENKFVAVNCPQHTDTNMTASELFGHKKGSFTGAVADRKGLFETAHNGVVFLDEIADLPIKTQVMLLRALAEGEFRRVGESESRDVSTRVVAATNRPLEDLVVKNEFRHDLLFRLNFFRITVPPLRERGDDWFQISEGFLRLLEKSHGVRRSFSRSSLELLSSYHWPGNVRQLHAIVTLGYSMSEKKVIDPGHFEAALDWELVPDKITGVRSESAGASGAADEAMLQLDGENGDPAFRGEELVAAAEEIRSIYALLKQGKTCFWSSVRGPFLDRELNRAQVRCLIERGLEECGGSYKRLLSLFHLSNGDYQKFMGFLKTHRLKGERRE